MAKQSDTDKKHPAVLDSEEMFRLAFEGARDAIFWADTETGILLNCNRAAEEMIERPRHEIIGKHQSFLHPPEMSEYFMQKFILSTADANPLHDVEAVVITRNGRQIPVHIKNSITRIAGSEIIQGIFRDVTEQKKAEKALLDANTLFQKTFDSLNEAVFIVQTATRVIQNVNSVVEKMFGYKREELIGATTLCLHLNEEKSREFGLGILKAYNEKGFFETTFQMRCKDGTIFDSEHCVSPIHDEEGRLISHACVVRDISDRVRSETVLKNTVLEQSAILENSCVGIALMQNWVFTRINSKFEEMFGYCNDELNGALSRSIFPTDELFEATGLEAYCTVTKGLVYESENEFIRNDGTLFWAKSFVRAIDPANPFAGIIWVIEDITKRKLAESALEEKTRLLEDLNTNLEKRVQQSIDELKYNEQIMESQNRLLTEFAPEAIIVFDVANGKIINANVHAEKLFGYSKEELFTTPSLFFHTGKRHDGLPSQQGFLDHCSRALEGDVLVMEQTLFNRHGVKLICEVRIVRMPSKGEHLIRVSLVDITERKKIQADLANALDTASKVNEEQKQFIGLISHELRTPLSIIDGAAQLLLLSSCPDSDCIQQADRIRSASQRLSGLLNTCFSDDRISSSGWVPDLRSEDIRKHIEDIADIYGNSSYQHRIIADIASLPELFYCDAGLIQVMLGNLIENAIKYSPLGGDITMLAHSTNAGEICFQVRDQGVGISSEHADKIFDRFYRTWQVSNVPGAGLGLHLVKKIAELHGGRVTCSSRVGHGSTFTVLLRSEN